MTSLPTGSPDRSDGSTHTAGCFTDLSVRRPSYSTGEKVRLLLWWIARALLFRTSFHTWNRFRAALLRAFGARIGQSVVLGPTVYITHPWNVEIGDFSQLGDYTWLYSIGRITIGRHCMVSQRSFLCTGGHDYTVATMPLTKGRIEVGDGAWVCADVFIAPGVRIGKDSIVGARSGVFADLPPMMICVGSPCKPMKPRPHGDGCQATDGRL